MSNTLRVIVPIELSRDTEGFWLHVQSKNGKSAAISLNGLAEGIIQDAFNVWAAEQLSTAFMSKRRKTGRKDTAGQDIYEGDIIRRPYNEHYGSVTGAIKWNADKAAFVAEGVFEEGGGWQTLNLEEAGKYVVIGNVFQSPEYLVPAKKIA